MAKTYIPTEYLNMPCKVVYSDYIRVYETTNDRYNNVYDIYFKNDYLVKKGTASFTDSIVCDNINTYTDDFYYRQDMPQILLMFVIFCIFVFIVPLKVFIRLFRRYR